MKKIIIPFLLIAAANVLNAQTLEKMQWFNEPEGWAIKDGTLTMSVTPHSDYWRISHYGFTEDLFVNHYKENRATYTQRVFEQDYDTYFMLDVYPELKGTIECPRCINEIESWLESIQN